MIIAILMLCACIASAGPSPSLSWRADVDRIQPVRGSVYRGETLALSCQLIRSGEVMDLTGLSASIYWQTNGMAAAWWSAPATAGTNGVTATLTPAMQPSASQILFFIGVRDSDQRHAYRATGVIRILHAPGEEPNDLPLPQLNIDFAQVTVTNAPWAVIASDLDAHLADRSNPHAVTAEQVGAIPIGGYDSHDRRFRLTSEGDFGLSYFGTGEIFATRRVGDRALDVGIDSDGLTLEDMGRSPSDGWRRIGLTLSGFQIDDQPQAGELSTMHLLLPKARPGTDSLATLKDIDLRKNYHWDPTAGVLWKTELINGFVHVIAVTNTPAIPQEEH